MKNKFIKVATSFFFVLCFILLLNIKTQAQFITTIAGNGYGAPNSGGYAGDGFQAINAELYEPDGLAVDTAGNVYIADAINNVIRKVTKSTGIITTIAGNGYGAGTFSGAYSGDGGPAINAELSLPVGVAVDDSGNVFITDTENNRIRKVSVTTGIITTVAGIDTAGYSGDGTLAIKAKIKAPTGVALDNSGNIYFADQVNKRVRKVNASTGIITTIAGTGTAGNTGNGGLATAATLGIPYSVALDKSGNVYISDLGNYNIRKITVATGIITTVAGNGTAGYAGNGGPATTAELAYPEHMAVDSLGNIFIADILNNVIRKVTAATGLITTVAGNDTAGFSGDGGPAIAAKLNSPCAVALDKRGTLYIGDSKNNRVRKIVECESVVPGIVTALRDTICANTKGSLTLVNNSGNPVQWQSSVNDTGFTNINKADSVKYLTMPLQQTTWYRVVAGTGMCSAFSNTLRLYVPPVLTASFYSTPMGLKQINFNSDSSVGNILNYDWDFGDGGTSTEKNPVHTFAKDSTYYVCLTLYDGSNCSYTYCKYESTATAIPAVTASPGWNIYPNPFNQQLTVSCKQMYNSVQSIEMYDMLGQLVVSKNFAATIGNTLQLDAPELAKGMYFLLIRTANSGYMQKVVKQ